VQKTRGGAKIILADENKIQYKWSKPPLPKPELYTNFVPTSWTKFDVRFQLGLILPTEPGVALNFEIEPQGAVTISWVQAKALRDVLTELVQIYEKTNGEIQAVQLSHAGANTPSKQRAAIVTTGPNASGLSEKRMS
jgi:hypothetical protein